ncbi:MAG: nucleotide exchange factor GrpE [Bacteroidales bacterium]|nr:nucleotide exchange factor GrpE [Bacteroidales bacterium]
MAEHKENKKSENFEKKFKEAEKALEKAEKSLQEAQKAQEEAEKAKEEAEKAKEEALGKAEANKNDYLRLMAEFDTFRRRSAEEKLELTKSASADTIKGLLPVLDDCEIALKQLSDIEGSEDAVEGISLILNKLTSYLKTKGLEKIEAKGKDFDTEFHEAVTMFPAPSEDLKGKVIDVAQNGYTLGGKVLRYAKVIVGA